MKIFFPKKLLIFPGQNDKLTRSPKCSYILQGQKDQADATKT